MITHRPYASLGKANHGWLKANHHFSFAQYYDENHINFGPLRVINDDEIAANTGFAPHPHQNMEIITYVRSGAVMHQDDQGNSGVTNAGEVQVMSAGSGIVHSEYNRTDTPLTLFQIWIQTNQHNAAPRWQTKAFPKTPSESLPLLVSGFLEDNQDTLFIHQLARIYGGNVAADKQFSLSIKGQAYVLASEGEFYLNDGQQEVLMQKGDGAALTHSKSLSVQTVTNSEILVIDVPETSS